MATGLTHQVTGTATGALVAAVGFHLGAGLLPCALILAGAASGARAPDYLEGSAIRHRTITHWWVIWAGLGILGIHAMTHQAPEIGGFLIGFAMSAITHLLLDFPNPMGVPFLTPYRRVSLNWWRSGRHEWLIVPTWLAVTLYPAFNLIR